LGSLKEVLVVGAGAAGMATAISAARQGAKVLLLESDRDLGGTVTHGLIHTLGGLYDSQGEYINEGLPVELAQRLVRADKNTCKRKMGRVWVLNACPIEYKKVVEDWIQDEPNINIIFNVSEIQVEIKGNYISSIEFTHGGRKNMSHPAVVVDCTGEAKVIGSVDQSLLIDDGKEALAGMIVRLRNVNAKELVFPKSAVVHRKIQSAVDDGTLPTECSKVWIDTGVYEDEVYVKFSVAIDKQCRNPEGQRAIFKKMEDTKERLISFLKNFPAFAAAGVEQTGQIAFRGGTRGKGEYQLASDDVRNLRKFPDAACRCCWPIEYWDPDRGVQLEYLGQDGYYEIPLRSLKVSGFENMWVAGKCFSSDYLAQASARVAGCCWAMGEAVGKVILR
jgi:ribulose 1,5-bisphosphate synthetase/thiazole synthase